MEREWASALPAETRSLARGFLNRASSPKPIFAPGLPVLIEQAKPFQNVVLVLPEGQFMVIHAGDDPCFANNVRHSLVRKQC